MSRFLFLFILSIIGHNAWTQNKIPDLTAYKTVDQKLEVLKKLSDSLLSNGENVEYELAVARYALRIAPPGHNYYQAVFRFYYGYNMKGIQVDTAIAYLEQSLSFAQKAGDRYWTFSSLSILCFLYNNYAVNIPRRDSVAAALEYIADTAGNDNIKGECYSMLANYNQILGRHEKVVTYLLYDLEILKRHLGDKSRTLNDSINMGITCINIGKAYLQMQQTDKAIEYTRMSGVYLRNNQSGYCNYLMDLSKEYLKKAAIGQAVNIYDSLTGLLLQRDGTMEQWQMRCALDLAFADFYLERRQTDTAMLYVGYAGKIGKKYPDPYNDAMISYTAGKIFITRNMFREAEAALKIAERAGPEMGRESYVNILKLLGQCYSGMGQWRLAAGYYQRYIPLRDSLYNESAKQSIANAEARYQNKDKQQQIDVQQQQLSFARKQQLWLIAGLILLCIVAMLLVVIYRNKRRTANALDMNNKQLSQLNNALEEANQTKAKLFGIISHDLRSPINQVYQFLKLQQMAPGKLDAEQRNMLSNKIQAATGSLLETMEDLLLWSKTQMNQFTTDMQKVQVHEVVSECLQLLQLNIEAKRLVIEYHVATDALVASDPYFLHIIVRNLLQNAIKASPDNGVISIAFMDSRLTIGNSGGYFSQQQYQSALSAENDARSLSGLGLRLVDELSRKIRVRVTFAETDGHTTCVQMVFS